MIWFQGDIRWWEGQVHIPKKPTQGDVPEPPAVDITARERQKVITWRMDYLKRAGYDGLAAARLAESNVDLRRAEDLLVNGCDEDTALRILL